MLTVAHSLRAPITFPGADGRLPGLAAYQCLHIHEQPGVCPSYHAHNIEIAHPLPYSLCPSHNKSPGQNERDIPSILSVDLTAFSEYGKTLRLGDQSPL